MTPPHRLYGNRKTIENVCTSEKIRFPLIAVSYHVKKVISTERPKACTNLYVIELTESIFASWRKTGCTFAEYSADLTHTKRHTSQMINGTLYNKCDFQSLSNSRIKFQPQGLDLSNPSFCCKSMIGLENIMIRWTRSFVLSSRS